MVSTLPVADRTDTEQFSRDADLPRPNDGLNLLFRIPERRLSEALASILVVVPVLLLIFILIFILLFPMVVRVAVVVVVVASVVVPSEVEDARQRGGRTHKGVAECLKAFDNLTEQRDTQERMIV